MTSLELSTREMVDFAGTSLSANEIVDFLKRSLQIKHTCQQLIYQQIVEQAAHERQVEVTPQEIQSAADEMRYELRLESVSRTMEWLSDQLITPQDWEEGVRDRLLSKKLRDVLFSGDVERVFAQSRLDYERVSIYRIQVPYYPLAQELLYQIEEGEMSFYEAAHLYDVDDQRRLRCGYDGRRHRWDFSPDVAAVVFGSSPQELLGPFPAGQRYDLLMVGEFIPAELNDETKNEILNGLFQEWLESELNHLIHNQNNLSQNDFSQDGFN